MGHILDMSDNMGQFKGRGKVMKGCGEITSFRQSRGRGHESFKKNYVETHSN